MEKKTSVDKQNTINIKSVPIQLHINASKFFNDDWKTIAFSVQRTDLAGKFVDKELRYNSLYFLFGYDDDGQEIVYVGQALKRADGESVLSRLREHDKSATERYRDKWSLIVVVTNEDDVWGSTELDALESIFINEIPDKNNLNGRRQNSAGAELSLYEDKVTQIKALITAIGYKIFENIPETESIQVTSVVNDYSAVEDLHSGMERIPEIVTPDRVVKEMVDMLPKEVWNSKTKFLDPACKGGEYLREIYDRLMETEVLQSEFPNTIERSNHILKDQIFGIALSKVSLDRTAKKLLGEDRNIRIIPNYINILRALAKANKELQEKITWQDILEKEFNREMKIDVVIGNPPYQETTGAGNNGGKAIYDSFILSGLDISDKLCMVVKNNWMNSNALMGLRETLIKNGLKTLINYSLLGDIFTGVGVAASIIYVDKNYSGDVAYTEIVKGQVINEYKGNFVDSKFIPASKYEYTIVKKAEAKAVESFSHHVIGNNPFGIDTNGKIYGEPIEESVIETDYYNIRLKYVDKDTYTNTDCFTKNSSLVDKYKIICPKQIHKTSNPIPSVVGLLPNNICSGSYSLMYCDTDMTKATNVAKYIKTRFFRFLTYCLADTLCALTAYRVSLVPDQNFTDQSDIDWSQSIADIDQQLYKKYNLTNEEIAYIEKTIKSMGATAQQPKAKFTKQDAMAAYIHQQLSKH